MSTQLILNLLFDPSDTTHTSFGRFAPYVADKTPLQTCKAWLQSNDGETFSFYVPPTQSRAGTNPGGDNITPLISKANQIQVGIRVGAVGGSWPAGYSPKDGPLYGWDPNGVPINPHALMITAVFGRHSQAGSQTWASPFQTPTNTTQTLVGNVITEVFYQGDFDDNNSCTMWLGAPQYVTSASAVDHYLFNVGAGIQMKTPAQPGWWYSCGHDPDMDVSM